MSTPHLPTKEKKPSPGKINITDCTQNMPEGKAEESMDFVKKNQEGKVMNENEFVLTQERIESLEGHLKTVEEKLCEYMGKNPASDNPFFMHTFKQLEQRIRTVEDIEQEKRECKGNLSDVLIPEFEKIEERLSEAASEMREALRSINSLRRFAARTRFSKLLKHTQELQQKVNFLEAQEKAAT